MSNPKTILQTAFIFQNCDEECVGFTFEPRPIWDTSNNYKSPQGDDEDRHWTIWCRDGSVIRYFWETRTHKVWMRIPTIQDIFLFGHNGGTCLTINKDGTMTWKIDEYEIIYGKEIETKFSRSYDADVNPNTYCRRCATSFKKCRCDDDYDEYGPCTNSLYELLELFKKPHYSFDS